MSVADKLITIANNTPLVCERLYTEKTVSGNPVVAGDVSSVKHNLKINLTSDDIIDFSGVTVSRYGKNLFNLHCEKSTKLRVPNKYVVGATRNNYCNPNAITELIIEDNNLTITTNTGYYGVGFFLNLEPDTDYIISCDISDVKKAAIGVGFYDNDWSYISNVSSWQTDYLYIKTPVDSGKVNICLTPTVANTSITFFNIQLELGSTATEITEYEPYRKPQNVTANTDGTVEGLTSLSPNMTLLADNSVSIECSYKSGGNPTANEKFIELQETFENVRKAFK